jgi:hypothetical protein
VKPARISRPSPAASKKAGAKARAGATSQPALPKGDRFDYSKVRGTLFGKGVQPGDVHQGNLGDCFYLAALDSLAQRNPSAIENAIKDNGNGTYTVRLYQHDRASGALKPVDVNVDAKLPTANGHLAPNQKLWAPVMEKAFAQLRDGYPQVDKGGYGGLAMETLTGKPSTYVKVEDTSPSTLWDQLKTAVASGRLTQADTYKQTSPRGATGKDSETVKQALKSAVNRGLVSSASFNPDTFTYARRGLVDDHSYTVLSVSEQAGQKFVTLRNPYGTGSPRGLGDGHNDGVLTMPLNEFAALYSRVYIGG